MVAGLLVGNAFAFPALRDRSLLPSEEASFRVNLALLPSTKVGEEHDFRYTATVHVIPSQLRLI